MEFESGNCTAVALELSGELSGRFLPFFSKELQNSVLGFLSDYVLWYINFVLYWSLWLFQQGHYILDTVLYYITLYPVVLIHRWSAPSLDPKKDPK